VICVNEIETSHHVVVVCPQAKALRFAMSEHRELPDDEQFTYVGKDWLLLLLDRCSKEQRSLILLLLWRAWHVHNGMTHGTGHTPVTESVGFLQSYRRAWNRQAGPFRWTVRGSRKCTVMDNQ